MLCKVEELRREMESRLDSQRRHMVQKESQLKNEVEELKVNKMMTITQQTSFSPQGWSRFQNQFGSPALRGLFRKRCCCSSLKLQFFFPLIYSIKSWSRPDSL